MILNRIAMLEEQAAHPDRPPRRFKVYKNSTAQNSTLHEHFEKEHKEIWAKECAQIGIAPKTKGNQKPKLNNDNVQDEPFTLDGMTHYLLRWIAADDQVRSKSRIYLFLINLYSPLMSSSASSFAVSCYTVPASSQTQISHTEQQPQRQWLISLRH
jgi:hypothetical protein